MPSAAVHSATAPKSLPLAERVVVALLLLVPLISLANNALSWLSFGIDLPYADDWRTYQDGSAYSLALKDLFTPANDTLFPVGRALDVLAMRWLSGNSVAYQFLSMIAVLGGLLFLQWRLLLNALRDRVPAAAAFTLTLFMLQPDSYWGIQNLAYHQAIPLLCLLASLWIVTIPLRALLAVPALFCLGVVSGFSYISGALAILTLAGVVLVFAVYSPSSRRTYTSSGLSLLAAGVLTSMAQVWVILSSQQGKISGKAHWPWAHPGGLDFWAYLLGKFGRSLMLPVDFPGVSLGITAFVVLVVILITLVFLARLLRGRLARDEEKIALIFVALASVIVFYLLLVAAGRAKARPNSITAFLDVFTFGFLRFHFFWVTLILPWVGATIFLWLARRSKGRRLALGATFLLAALVLPTGIWLGGFDHATFYKGRMAYRLENEVKCLEAGLQEDSAIICRMMTGPPIDLAPIYDFARRHGASFTRYFFDLRKIDSAGKSLPLRSLEEGPTLVEQRPVGEIVAGTSVVQSVPLRDDELQALIEYRHVCLSLLLATYDRPNEGRAKVSFSVAGATAQFDLPFPVVENNQYRSFCGYLEGPLTLNQVSNNLIIRVDGIAGVTGSAITAWLTKDVSRGTAVVNGADTGLSLLFTLKPLDPYRWGGILSIVLCALLTVLLALGFVGLTRSRGKTVDVEQ